MNSFRCIIIPGIALAVLLVHGCEKKPDGEKNASIDVLAGNNQSADTARENGSTISPSSAWDEWVQPDTTTEEEVIPVFTEVQPVKDLNWEELVPGLEYVEAPSFIRCTNIGDNLIRIVRADLTKLKLRLLIADQLDTGSMTADVWCNHYKMLAVINAGMYGSDHYSSTGFMKNRNFTNRTGFNPAYKTIVVFDPVENDLPYFQILDTDCQPDWKALVRKYRSAAQGLRMIDCRGSNRWGRQPQYWSTACIGEDSSGRVLFIHSRTPYMVSDLNRILLSLPLNIGNVMYVEGGPESSLYVRAGGHEKRSFGSYETGFNLNDANEYYWDIPNVVAIMPGEQN